MRRRRHRRPGRRPRATSATSVLDARRRGREHRRPGACDAPRREIVARVEGVPGFGWRTFEAVDGDGPATGAARRGARCSRTSTSGSRSTRTPGPTRSRPPTGCVADGLGRLVDGGDGGDTYNYSPPAEDVVIDRPEAVTVTLHESGPVRAQLRVLTWYRWPQHAVGDERRCTPPQRRADPHRGGDHARAARRRARSCGCAPSSTTAAATTGCARTSRCRAPVDHSHAECAFAVVERGLTTEGGPHETGLPTFVSRRFVDASDGAEGLALVHDGLLEYEVVDDGTRARAHPAARHRLPLPVGDAAAAEPGRPARPARRPAAPGAVAVEYAVALHRGDWADADLHDLADDVLVPLERVRAAGAGDRPADRTAAAGPTARSPRRCTASRADSSCASTTRRAEPRTVEIERDETPAHAAGSSTCAAGRSSASRARSSSRAAGIATAPPRPLTELDSQHRTSECRCGASMRDAWATRSRSGGAGSRRPGRWSTSPARAPGAVSSTGRDGTPSGGVSSHSSAGCSPCHRSANDSAAVTGRRVVHLEVDAGRRRVAAGSRCRRRRRAPARRGRAGADPPVPDRRRPRVRRRRGAAVPGPTAPPTPTPPARRSPSPRARRRSRRSDPGRAAPASGRGRARRPAPRGPGRPASRRRGARRQPRAASARVRHLGEVDGGRSSPQITADPHPVAVAQRVQQRDPQRARRELARLDDARSARRTARRRARRR